MKKEYIKPEMEVEVIETESLLSLSLGEGEATNDKDQLVGDITEGKNRNDNWGGLLW